MAKVAIDVVKKSGVDVSKLLDLLVKNAAAELTTYYYYTILRANLGKPTKGSNRCKSHS